MATKPPIRVERPITQVLQEFVYTFTLKSFKITNTRSVHEDTDYVSIAVAVGTNPPITVPTKSMGNLNNGTYQVNLSIGGVEVPAAQPMAFSYSILNSGYNQDTVEEVLQKVVGAAASKGASAAAAAGGTAIGGPVGGVIGAVGTAAAGWALGKLEGIIFADCDGSVAAGDHLFTGAQLAQQTAGGKVITATDNNKGSNSPDGCGSNSQYYVTWSISAAAKRKIPVATMRA